MNWHPSLEGRTILHGLQICQQNMLVLGWFGIHKEWDFGSGQLIENLCWPPGNVGVEPCRLYCAVYGTGFSQNLIAAGGSGSNEACLIDANSRDVVGRISTGDKGSCRTSPLHTVLCIAVFEYSQSPEITLCLLHCFTRCFGRLEILHEQLFME
uniref:Uncharacterized protein n=1 Tax=Physcomitrium patens TaxID=3218 RepID=A0A2K1LBL1_PHYPA|nr:hypothetical protein PHYPA_001844 [Physcomitrium patens]